MTECVTIVPEAMFNRPHRDRIDLDYLPRVPAPSIKNASSTCVSEPKEDLQ